MIGLQAIGKLVAEELLKQKKLGMEVVGFVGQSAGQLTLSYGNPAQISLPVYNVSSLMALFEQKNVNRILIARVDDCGDVLGRELSACSGRGEGGLPLLLRQVGKQDCNCRSRSRVDCAV